MSIMNISMKQGKSLNFNCFLILFLWSKKTEKWVCWIDEYAIRTEWNKERKQVKTENLCSWSYLLFSELNLQKKELQSSIDNLKESKEALTKQITSLESTIVILKQEKEAW